MKVYDVIIVGGGVSGTALLYSLSHFSNIKKIALIEKYSELGEVNSKSTQNSQTLHFGDIETNYTLEKSIKVKKSSDMLKKYLEKSKSKHKNLFSIYPKMVLAVGKDEVEELSKRYDEFKSVFPKLKKINRLQIAKIEPNVVKDRDKKIPIIALHSTEGYTVDYGLVAKALANDSKRNGIDIMKDTKLLGIEKIKENNFNYLIKTNKGSFKSTVVIIAAGAHSLMIAQSLGYGQEFGILSVAGSFYNAPKLLNGKVYTMQVKKLPFAAVHGDPEVHNSAMTRFGPTAKPIFMLERYNYSTIGEYFKTLGFGWKQIATLTKLLSDSVVSKYIFKNFFYDWPIIGKRLFIKQAQKVVPSIKISDIEYAKGYGGNRPQIINLNKKTMDTGEAKILGENIIFTITPSPGASTCLGNAYTDSQTIAQFLNKNNVNSNRAKTVFYKEKFEKEFV